MHFPNCTSAGIEKCFWNILPGPVERVFPHQKAVCSGGGHAELRDWVVNWLVGVLLRAVNLDAARPVHTVVDLRKTLVSTAS